ncbi:MAG: cell division protein SepF [Clostridia bacterium]|nr:cell division protein SepF [Clostridia bacterium]
MSIKEIKDRLTNRFANRGPKDFAKRPDGGTSCYRPFQKRSTAAEENGTTVDQIPYAHTGFTGMNPPSEEGTFSSRPGQNESETPYNAFGGYGAPLTQNTAPRNETGYRNNGAQDNISYMPGVFSQAGTGIGATVETVNIVTMTSLRSCYDAIASMKNGEILILSMDAIANDGEVTRCQDMLAGAAFTLGCTVRPLAGTRMILVAPASVRILPAERERVQPLWQPQPVYAQPAAPAADQPRQRRAVQNYDLYGNTSAGVNPYTGRTPVTAGEYTNYGGYGY